MKKKLLSVLLAMVMLLTCIPLGSIPVFAEEVTPEQPAPVSEEEYIYYSDLFYGYSSYLMSAPAILGHYTETQSILNQVYQEYRDSPSFKFSNLKDALGATFNLKEWVKKVTDMFGLTSFTYEKALDAANVDLATHMLGGSAMANYYGASAKWVKKFNDILKVYDTFDKNYDVRVMTETEVFTAMIAVLDDSSVLTYINHSTLTTLTEDLLPHISSITKACSKGGDALTAAKTIATGIMLEDFRLEMIDAILKNAPSGTMLYDGLSRLKSQMQGKFVTYFLENYVKEAVLGELADGVVKKVTKTVMGNYAGLYALIGAVTKVTSWIVFDCIFQVPDIDELTKQMVLSEYAYNLYDALETQAGKFSAQFTTQDVTNFETIATAYIAATNAALSASDAVKLSSNQARLAEITKKYSANGFYDTWMENVKDYVRIIPAADRTITDYGNYKLTNHITLLNGSDTIKDGHYLYVVAGKIKGNIIGKYKDGIIIHIYGSLTVPEDVSVTIDGNLDDRCHVDNKGNLSINGNVVNACNVKNNGNLTVSGDVESRCYIVNKGKLHITGNFTNATMDNCGLLEVDGNVVCTAFSYYLYQLTKGAELRIGGNFNWHSSNYCRTTAGKVVFDGEQLQTVSGLSARTIVIDNASEEGVVFSCSIKPSVLFDHRGNNFTLYNNGSGSTFVDYDGDGMKDNVDPEPTVHNHTYDDEYDVYCNTCGAVREAFVAIVMFSGNSVSEDVVGLAFRFELAAKGVVKDRRNVVDLTNATINCLGTEYKLVGMGCVVTNNKVEADNLTLDTVNNYNVIDIPTVYLQEADEDSCAFASRIIDIPDRALACTIYARPYFIVEVDGEQITIYGDVNSAACADYL